MPGTSALHAGWRRTCRNGPPPTRPGRSGRCSWCWVCCTSRSGSRRACCRRLHAGAVVAVLRTLLASLVLLAAGIGVLSGVTDGFRAYTTESARRIDVQEHPRAVPALALQAADGRRTDFAKLRGRWLLVEFIYTRCMTYCSAQGGEFARLQDQLARPIRSGAVVLLSISFD